MLSENDLLNEDEDSHEEQLNLMDCKKSQEYVIDKLKDIAKSKEVEDQIEESYSKEDEEDFQAHLAQNQNIDQFERDQEYSNSEDEEKLPMMANINQQLEHRKKP